MNELKLPVTDVAAMERRFIALGGRMDEPRWAGNWYLDTTPDGVLKISQDDGVYTLQRLKKLDAGYAFVEGTPIDDITPYGLSDIAAHNLLHKIVRPWMVCGLSVDILVFDDIGNWMCVNYADGERDKALEFIRYELDITSPQFLEVPFNVLKRRKLGQPDFD